MKKGGFAELADSPKFCLWQGEKKFIIKTNSYRKNLERKERCVYDRRYFKVQQGVCGEKSI